MPTRLGTSRTVNVMMPVLSSGMSRSLWWPWSPPWAAAGAANTVVEPSAAAAAVTPAPATSLRRLIFQSAMSLSYMDGGVDAADGDHPRHPMAQTQPAVGRLTPAPPNSTQLRLKKLFPGPPAAGRNTR